VTEERGQAFPLLDAPAVAAGADGAAARLRRMVDHHYDLVWRTARSLGLPDGQADDVAQQVFCVVARKLADIAPEAERAFILSTLTRVASEARRAARRLPATADDGLDQLELPLPSQEELVDQRRARQTLDEVLAAMPIELRVVFVLYEIEELTLPEIASALGLRLGTATSRLRRAREAFRNILKRRMAAVEHAGRRGGRK
jgi:RNA polymerase sigma-70 factor (ECF subfamily)